MKFRIQNIIIFLLLIFINISCSNNKQIVRPATINKQTPTPDYSSTYNPGSAILHPDFLVYHNSPDTSQINIRLYFKELRFNMANPQKQNMARIKIKYVLYPEFENLEVIDSASHILNVIPAEGSDYFVGGLKIHVENNKEYVLEISVEDMLRGSSGKSYINIDKTSEYNAQNFKVYSAENMTQLFSPNMFNNRNVNIQYKRMPGNNIKVEQYIIPRPFPNPPYLVDSIDRPLYRPDRTSNIGFRDLQDFHLEEKGLYFFQLSPTDTAGLLLGYFSEDFPRINTVGQMIEPVKYLTTDEEYLNILAKTNKKLALDNFWLRLTGSTDAARELIRIYYNRVLFANFYFTDVSQGWRTDRGMTYIIFGNPDKITRFNNEEVWTYNRNLMSSNNIFRFQKIRSKLSNNLFHLVRDQKYKNTWDQAINTWKSGKPYSLSE